MLQKKKFTEGYTFLEIMIVLGILSMLAAAITISFTSFNGEQSVDKTTLTIISILNGAHSSAVSSKCSVGCGVRIQNNKVTTFTGTYGTANVDYTFSNLVTVSTSTGIGTDIIFQNLTGYTTSASGTITVSLISNPTKYNEVIQVYSTGAVQKN